MHRGRYAIGDNTVKSTNKGNDMAFLSVHPIPTTDGLNLPTPILHTKKMNFLCQSNHGRVVDFVETGRRILERWPG